MPFHFIFLPLLLLLLLLLQHHHPSAADGHHHHHHHHHKPFFPLDSIPPAPSPLPHHLPKLPLSSTSSRTPQTPFFPSYLSPPPPSPTVYTSFPADISLLIPHPPSPSRHRHRHLLLAVSISLLCAALFFAVAALLLFLRRRSADKPASRPDSVRLYPPNTASSDGSEFLYLGTLANPSYASGAQSSPYQKLGSPELNPLPPLPKHNEDEEFFSPRGSSGRTATKVAGISFQSRSPSYSSPASSVSTVKARSSDDPVSDSAHNNYNSNIMRSGESSGKLKLKPLHWDKVRSSSDRAMVWDHVKSNSFVLNEEMMETLFMANNTNKQPHKGAGPNKSQNIGILLRALHLTTEDVCRGLLEGNSDSLGAELLESLLKMAPTKEEEWRLRHHKHDSLAPPEKFLKSLLEIPFAFKRVAVLLYIANFDSELDHLKRSFATLQVACGELKGSRMLMKLLESVLKIGNRMNMGMHRGGARAFKLNTLLKLVDVKGSDGRTTILHFVVQEMVRAEGLRLSATNQNVHFVDDVEFRKVGLQVVSGLSGELSNVKKAATINPDVLTNEVAKLAAGIPQVSQVLKSNHEAPNKDKFADTMKEFLNRAEEEIRKLHTQQKLTASLVREITEYFHGSSDTDEANGFRIFTVVKDFLLILDQVCKQVGKINERSRVGLGPAPQFPFPLSPQPLHGTS